MFGNKLKELLRTKEENQEGNDKRKIENLVFFYNFTYNNSCCN